jgi:ComF family protein
MAIQEVTGLLDDFLSLFFPNECLACAAARVKGEALICTSCMLELPRSEYHLQSANPLMARLSYRLPVREAVALFRFTKSSRVQRLLHALKYRNRPEVGIVLGRYYASQLADTGFFREIDLIVPVPLHPVRLRVRGYNQSVQFAAGLSEISGIPYSDTAMQRSRRTESQTAKSKLNRWENMRGVFSLIQDHEEREKNILLVDDVITTGATVEACALALFGAGSRQVSIACIAEA